MSRSKEEIYNESTLRNLGNNPNGTRMDVVYDAMDVFAAQEVKSNSTALVNLFLQECGIPELFNQEMTVGEIKQVMQIAKDTYFEKRAMELLSFQAKHNVECEVDTEGKEVFYYKGELISKEQLFQNFL